MQRGGWQKVIQEAEAPHDMFDGSGVAVINTLLPGGGPMGPSLIVLTYLTAKNYLAAVNKALWEADLPSMPIVISTRLQLVPLQLSPSATPDLLADLSNPATAAAAAKLLAGPADLSAVSTRLAGLLPDGVAARLPQLGVEHACSSGTSLSVFGAPPFSFDVSRYKCVTYRTNVIDRTVPMIVRQWDFTSSPDDHNNGDAGGVSNRILYCSYQQLQEKLNTMSKAAQAATASGGEAIEQVAVVWHRFKAAKPEAFDAEQLSGFPESIHKWIKEDLGHVDVEVNHLLELDSSSLHFSSMITSVRLCQCHLQQWQPYLKSATWVNYCLC